MVATQIANLNGTAIPSSKYMDILSSEQQELLKRTRDTLGQLRDALGQTTASDEDREALADSIKQLDELFLLVIAGEFNAGKSTFINALIGEDLQDVGVTPTTSHIHLLKYGNEVSSQAMEAGVWLHTAPADLLRQINIVDTPGTNAIVREHEALTSEFIPRSDLVLFVTSADRPFTESERNFLEEIKAWGKKIVLVINKVDILDNPVDREKVIAFVNENAIKMLGGTPTVFAVSAKQAKTAKEGNPRLWTESGFERVEDFIFNTLDDAGRFALKLNNPLGVGQKLIAQQLSSIESDLEALSADAKLLDDIERQTNMYDGDMQRNFQARLGEIDNVIYEMEKRGNEFFDETMRIGRIPDLMRRDRIQMQFERDVIADTPQRIEEKVGELIDWMVEQDLRQWTAVADALRKKQEEYVGRIVGEGGPKEGTLAYDRQRLVDSIGYKTRLAVATYDREEESRKLADLAREATVGVLGIGGVGLGAGIALFAATAFDITGILTGVASLTLGMLVLPARKRKARQELQDKLAELRSNLMGALNEQFSKEMQRGQRRLEDAVAPFSRFVRAEQEKINDQRGKFVEIEAHIVGLKSQTKALEANAKSA